MPVTTIWIAGRKREDEGWELLGVYSTETLAAARCRWERDFIGPVPLDTDLPESTVTWPGVRYPVEAT